MPIALPASFAHALKTCEGYVSDNADKYDETKKKLCSLAQQTLRDKPAYKYWGSAAPNAAVIQLDGNYFVVDTDDEESDDFTMDIMAKYGIVDNVTPSLSNYLLGLKNKNHYYFQLPEDIRWTCVTNYVNPAHLSNGKKTDKASKLDLLGSTNRIMFENISCLDRLKNIPMMTQEMLDDICSFVPKALLGDKLEFKPAPAPKPIVAAKPKENIVVSDFGLPADVKKFIDENTRPEDAGPYQSWSVVLTKIANKYGMTSLGLKAAHYFSAKDPAEYLKEGNPKRVTEFYNKIDLSKESIQEYKFWKIETNGKCIIQLDDDDLSAATTAVNTDAEEEEVFESAVDMLIKPHEDKNFTTICAKIVPAIKKVLIYCREEWYSYDDQTHLWSTIKEPQKIIKKHLFECVAANNKDVAIRLSKVPDSNEALRKSLIELQAQYLNMYKKIESLQTLALVRKDLETDLRDNEFCNKLDQTAGKLIFKDGIYDIETDTFEAGLKYEHFLTYTLPYKYRKPTAEDKERVQRGVMQICADEDWRYNYYMEILGYSMLGMPDKEQAAFFMVGETAGNGKSTLLEALTEMMPNVVVKLNSKTFSEGNSDYKKSIHSIKGARIAWINEVQKKKQDVDAIKDIADGKPINNPVLYQQKEEKIQIKSKLFFVSNNEVAFANDAGIKRRYRYVEFIAKFHTQQEHDALQTKRPIDFVADNAFAQLLITERGFFALLELILEGARRWCSAKRLVIPEHYIKLANAACEKNDEYAEFVSNNIVKCEGEFVSKFEIEERYKEKYDRKMASEKDVFRKYMASKGFKYDCEKSVRVKVYENGAQKSKVKDGVYMGCKLTELEEVEEVDE
jgi:phage/plasmid-associated DNA primase